MAKRVGRVKRSRGRSRLKSLKNVGGDAAPADVGAHIPIGAADGDGPGDATSFTKRKRKIGRKGGAGGASEAEGVGGDLDVDDALATDLAITRKGGGGFGDQGGDGFDRGREAYEAYMRGNVEKDAERFAELRHGGAVDDFDPALDPHGAELLGQFKSAAHIVRMYDHWTLNQVDRSGAIENAATWLAGFQRPENVRKVLIELESKPIRDIYPLEVMLELLDKHPEKLPGVARGTVLGGAAAFHEDRVFAGHPVQLPVPPNTRLKAFALLGGERPGYEFFPSKKDGYYTLLIDTPGQWEFALYAVRTQALGKMTKELAEGVVERLVVNVQEMGKKERPAGGVRR